MLSASRERMGDSTCLMHGFSYASAIPNESKQGNPLHALGESISFGRFMTESLSWEKWSSFSSSPHKKYAEEAERYAQPGSVAQKKAFFEAHYKRIAAQKAAADAALLDQQNDARIKSDGGGMDNNGDDDDQQKRVILDVVEKIEDVKEVCHGVNGNKEFSSGVDVIKNSKEGGNVIITENEASGENPLKRISASGSEISGTPLMEMPLLKKDSVGSENIPSVESKKKSSLSCLKSSIKRKTWIIPSTPVKPVTTTTTTTPRFKKEDNAFIQGTRKSNVDYSTDKKKSSSTKSLRELINLVPIKEPDKEPISATKKGYSSTKTPKDCCTPLRTSTPINVGTTKGKGTSKNSATTSTTTTPLTENRRMKTPVDPSAVRGSKTTGPKWHILSAVSKSVTAYRDKLLSSPSLSTPFTLRTEERAAKRKQKLEEKFNANAVQKAQIQNNLKEKAGNELRKLSCTFCFKAHPLPDFYKEREASVNQFKKTPTTRPQTVVLGRSNSNKKQGTISMPPPPRPPPKCIAKNGASKNLSKKKVANGSKFLTTSLPERITHENKSPNIQQ